MCQCYVLTDAHLDMVIDQIKIDMEVDEICKLNEQAMKLERKLAKKNIEGADYVRAYRNQPGDYRTQRFISANVQGNDEATVALCVKLKEIRKLIQTTKEKAERMCKGKNSLLERLRFGEEQPTVEPVLSRKTTKVNVPEPILIETEPDTILVEHGTTSAGAPLFIPATIVCTTTETIREKYQSMGICTSAGGVDTPKVLLEDKGSKMLEEERSGITNVQTEVTLENSRNNSAFGLVGAIVLDATHFVNVRTTPSPQTDEEEEEMCGTIKHVYSVHVDGDNSSTYDEDKFMSDESDVPERRKMAKEKDRQVAAKKRNEGIHEEKSQMLFRGRNVSVQV